MIISNDPGSATEHSQKRDQIINSRIQEEGEPPRDDERPNPIY